MDKPKDNIAGSKIQSLILTFSFSSPLQKLVMVIAQRMRKYFDADRLLLKDAFLFSCPAPFFFG
jgi:hypothetical protein